jgi:hypothetical protein
MIAYFLDADQVDITREHATSTQKHVLTDIIRIVNPTDPLFKLLNESIYSDSLSSPESQKIENAIRLYAQEICIKKG